MQIKVRAISKADIRLGKPMMFHQAMIDGEPYFVHEDIRYPYAGVMFDDDFIKMLSTGLRDRHGKEIWEGDRVKYTSHSGYNMEDFIAVIKWCEEGACWGYKRETEMYVSYFSGHDELFKDVLPYLEVIGNIYEEGK